MKIFPEGISPKERCANSWEVKPSSHITSPSSLGTTPKPLGIFHPKGKPTPDDVGLLIGIVEVEGTPPPMMKPRLDPPTKEDPYVGIKMDGMGVGMLDNMTNGIEDTDGVP
jgi:hypothetical protein